MSMKKLLFVLLMAMSLTAHSQSSMGIWGNVVNTEDGTRLELKSSKETGGGYNLQITCRYYNLSAGENTFLALTIPSSKVETFKNEFRQIQSKYNEWLRTAKANKVQEVEKDIPVQITSVSDMFGGSMTYPEKKSIKAVFFIYNSVPHCIIKSAISGYNIYQQCEWLLTANDFPKILSEIDRTIEHQRNYDSDKKKTEELFH